MAYGAGAGAGAAAAAAAIANAIKASGAIVRVEPEDFISIVSKTKDPLVVIASGGVFQKHYDHLTAYKGLIFYTKSPNPLMLPSGAEVIYSKQIWIPA
jgi:ABC-type transport system substrate-binding protein